MALKGSPTLWTAIRKSNVHSMQGLPLAAVLHDLAEANVMHVDRKNREV